ncbi:vitamin K-dependent gamma-carboxylase isoform X1 [Microplitis demolitor]|uniref:vitamin K-dependent gamma-carboxylase isoform X1 n=2 Tax=Microplitis demolitor TaxID=69319 RepID=UPI00235B60B7|nr:vitamin K-dependent gamma-carboxylase isoform X1 [Microplitis demolitor]
MTKKTKILGVKEKKSAEQIQRNENSNEETEVKNVNYYEKVKDVIKNKFVLFKDKFENCCGFSWSDLKSFDNFVRLLYRPTDPASLGVARALFGLCMVLDVVEERGLADIDLKWGDPYSCHFPLIHGMQPLSLPWMILLFTVMWLGAFGIMLGFCFKLACACFLIPYWYIFLLDKSFWNNHSYLYGVVTLLLWGTQANRYFSLDAVVYKQNEDQNQNQSIPLWNYFIIKFQFFALYFLAGLKKSSKEWLDGYSMTNLSEHWVFDPFKMFLTTEQTDFFIVHWFGFIFDLTVGFWMLFDKTRIPAMIFCTAFHLMNSRLFSIGMFPYVCLATMPLFCRVDWPRKFIKKFKISSINGECDSSSSNQNNGTNFATDHQKNEDKFTSDGNMFRENETENSGSKISGLNLEVKNFKPTKKQKFVVSLLLVHIFLQFFLPYSHFITKGYNNWTPGLYGYSWDMMVHSWDTVLIVVRVHDNEKNEDHFVDPRAWVQNDKWSKHGDMAIQYAQCLKNNLLRRKKEVLKTAYGKNSGSLREWSQISNNLSIYIDVRCSLNGRFQQRIFNPDVDMLTVDWHPFKPVSFLMPLLTQLSSYRKKMDEITRHVYSWSNFTDVFFVADYPGMMLENYFSEDFSNISLTILEGEVTYVDEDSTDKVTLTKDRSVSVSCGKLHEVTTTSAYPSCYMYTYTNQSRENLEIIHKNPEPPRRRSGFPIMKEIRYKINAWWRAFGHIANAFFYLAYDVPMLRRVPRALNYYEYD